MKNTRRQKKHPKYFRIDGYQIVANLTDEQVAAKLGVCIRTYRDKVNGSKDFTAQELLVLSGVLQQPADALISVE